MDWKNISESDLRSSEISTKKRKNLNFENEKKIFFEVVNFCSNNHVATQIGGYRRLPMVFSKKKIFGDSEISAALKYGFLEVP